MKKKSYIILIVMIFLSVSLGSAYAKKRHNRHNDIMKGVVIGAGTALIGAAIINDLSHHKKRHHKKRHHKKRHHKKRHHCDDYYDYCDGKHHHPHDRCEPDGYWKKRKIWVESPCYSFYGEADNY